MAIAIQIIYIAGVLALTYVAYQVVIFLATFLLPSRLHIYHHGPQPWACVTGASDGIGRGVAEELAANNFNLILHGRNPTKLETVRASIKSINPSVDVKLFVFDTNEYKTIESSSLPSLVQGLNLTILVNNVGLGYDLLSPADIDAQINTNLRFTTHLTHHLLPHFQSLPGPSLILTMSSTTAIGMPWVSVYAGSKAYLRAWGRSLGMQLRAESGGKSKVEFLTMDIVEVSTAANAQPVTFLRPTPRDWARTALKRVGYGWRYVHGFWPHALQKGFVDCMSETVQDWVLLPVMSKRREALGKTK